MKLKKIIEAFEGVCSVCRAKCSAADALKIAKLAKQMSFYMESFCTEEQKLLRLYGQKGENGEPIINNGVPSFASTTDKLDYVIEREKLLAVEVEDIEGITLKLSDLKLTEGQFSASEIISMSGIIDIEE